MTTISLCLWIFPRHRVCILSAHPLRSLAAFGGSLPASCLHDPCFQALCPLARSVTPLAEQATRRASCLPYFLLPHVLLSGAAHDRMRSSASLSVTGLSFTASMRFRRIRKGAGRSGRVTLDVHISDMDREINSDALYGDCLKHFTLARDHKFILRPIKDALKEARQARFEHGETPEVW